MSHQDYCTLERGVDLNFATMLPQLIDFLPWSTFAQLVDRYDGDHRVRTLTCAEQFRALGVRAADLSRNIPTFIHISNGRMHDVNVIGEE